MRMLMIVLPMMFLILGASSCSTTQKIVCREVRDNEIKPLPLCDISFQFNRCRCRCFKFSTWESLPLNECKDLEGVEEAGYPVTNGAVNFPLKYCENLSGFSLDDMANEVRPKIKGLNNLKNDYCTN